MAMYVLYRQHCGLSICEYWLSWTNTVRIRTKDPNNHSDTETGTLSSNITYQVLIQTGILFEFLSANKSISEMIPSIVAIASLFN